MASGWILSALLTALIAIVVSSVSARVCTLMIDLDSRGCGQRMGRFVLPPWYPCTCTGVRLGGHYHRYASETQGQDPPLYMDMLPEETAEAIGRWFNCTASKLEDSTPTRPPADCQEILDAGQTTSGVYTIQHEGENMEVFCRMESGKGYVVLQRRLDGSVNFSRSWQEYAEGFGDLTGEFWLGNEKLRSLASRKSDWELVITLRAFDGDEARVRYKYFNVFSFTEYILIATGFSEETGNAGNAMLYENGKQFSTRDASSSNRVHCNQRFHAGWWYVYYNNAAVGDNLGRQWVTWKGNRVSLKGCEMMTRLKCTPAQTTLPADCQEILDAGQTTSGVYTIHHACQNMTVYCRMELEKGYIVFQRRLDGSVNFDRTWQEYDEGFGDLSGELWLGNQKLSILTRTKGNWELVITLRAFDGDEARVRYSIFSIHFADNKYLISLINGYRDEIGHAGDSFEFHEVFFSTRDVDNDYSDTLNCAQKCQAGWWYRRCGSNYFQSNLNGLYYNNVAVDDNMGIQWATWKGNRVSLKGCEMMIRRIY